MYEALYLYGVCLCQVGRHEDGLRHLERILHSARDRGKVTRKRAGTGEKRDGKGIKIPTKKEADTEAEVVSSSLPSSVILGSKESGREAAVVTPDLMYRTLTQLTVACIALKKVDEAEDFFIKILSLASKRFGVRSLKFAAALSDLASFSEKASRFESRSNLCVLHVASSVRYYVAAICIYRAVHTMKSVSKVVPRYGHTNKSTSGNHITVRKLTRSDIGSGEEEAEEQAEESEVDERYASLSCSCQQFRLRLISIGNSKEFISPS